MISFNARLQIEGLGQRGEGLSRGPDGTVFVPYALPGETIIAEVDGSRGKLVEIRTASPDRIRPICRYFSACGGCAVQTLAEQPYAQWKQGLLADAMRQAGIKAKAEPLRDAHGAGRRRATFHARTDASGRAITGFMEARAHKIVEIEGCPVLAPSLQEAPQIARALAQMLAASGRPLDILMTATASGLDVDLKGHGPLNEDETQRLVRFALRHDLARLSNHGAIVTVQRPPVVLMGKAMVAVPPGAFLQATEAGEAALAEEVCAALTGASRIADLFAGVGTFSLRLAAFAPVHAIDADEPALDALAKAARSAALRPVTIETRNLFRRPLSAEELAPFDAVIFDPPRAGAELQARAIAKSRVPVIVAVSCNAQTFARDAAILCSGGYALERVLPVDQFRYSPHLEIVATFKRSVKPRARRLLS
ncbi:class I SAM-dependent RNA methyltransferase [Methylocella tundrae]|uniref:Putative enzyme n=1 Tax=Methylocella tundrae TaxID=227605 RepID=A0A4U8YYV7_METTU|nr:class I SAM-dependent RNA methyltransferase [Methylocella tundrae]WPP05605.1 class I SAM-dependent RNA methyltransferase [Methylocella tundrae]VFU08058.1 putative enzyme [Methylocella tundrae]